MAIALILLLSVLADIASKTAKLIAGNVAVKTINNTLDSGGVPRTHIATAKRSIRPDYTLGIGCFNGERENKRL